jgi:hypothetical protein
MSRRETPTSKSRVLTVVLVHMQLPTIVHPVWSVCPVPFCSAGTYWYVPYHSRVRYRSKLPGTAWHSGESPAAKSLIPYTRVYRDTAALNTPPSFNTGFVSVDRIPYHRMWKPIIPTQLFSASWLFMSAGQDTTSTYLPEAPRQLYSMFQETMAFASHNLKLLNTKEIFPGCRESVIGKFVQSVDNIHTD